MSVRLTPRADREAVVYEPGPPPLVRARVAAPPVGGQANAALVKLLAKRLNVPKSRITIARGETARDKVVRVAGLTPDDAHARLRAKRG